MRTRNRPAAGTCGVRTEAVSAKPASTTMFPAAYVLSAWAKSMRMATDTLATGDRPAAGDCGKSVYPRPISSRKDNSAAAHQFLKS